MNHRVAWIVAVLVALAVAVLAAFAFGLVKYEPPRQEPTGGPAKTPGSPPKANPDGR